MRAVRASTVRLPQCYVGCPNIAGLFWTGLSLFVNATLVRNKFQNGSSRAKSVWRHSRGFQGGSGAIGGLRVEDLWPLGLGEGYLGPIQHAGWSCCRPTQATVNVILGKIQGHGSWSHNVIPIHGPTALSIGSSSHMGLNCAGALLKAASKSSSQNNRCMEEACS